MCKLFTSILILFFVNCNSQQSTRKNIILAEDDYIQISLNYLEQANLGISDWIKLDVKNKVEKDIFIISASYSINKEKIDNNGNRNMNQIKQQDEN